MQASSSRQQGWERSITSQAMKARRVTTATASPISQLSAVSLDTEIKMTLSDSSLYPKSDSIPTKVVSLEPHGTIFKKPVVITLKTEQKISFRLVSAAVWDEQADQWRYSREGAFAVYGKSDSGDPIMTNAMGDPIMLSADGDFIYKDSSGDPIMLTSMGDPIMLSKSEDPVKNAAMGDPIMLATGHFSTFTFILVDSSEYEASQKCISPAVHLRRLLSKLYHLFVKECLS